VVEWTGTDPLKASLELFLDGWAAARNINAELGVLRALAPMRPSTQPPVFYVLGCAQIPSTVPWTANGLDLSDWVLRGSDGQPTRATATLTLIEYRIGDVVTRSSPAKRSKDRNGSGSKGKARTYTVRAGDTLGGIAAKTLGSAARWTELKTLNSLRDPNHLKVGTVLKLPTK
jgi:nucleoid-associated protein YgaU